MPETRIEVDDRQLRRVVAAGKRLGPVATTRLRLTFDAIGLKLMGAAEEKSPVGETGILSGSGDVETRSGVDGLSVTVTFGGMSSKYAEVQHERDDYTHTRSDYAVKYPGRSTAKLKGHHGGQAHFLWGNEDSAYNSEFRAWHNSVVDSKLAQIAGEVLDGG